MVQAGSAEAAVHQLPFSVQVGRTEAEGFCYAKPLETLAINAIWLAEVCPLGNFFEVSGFGVQKPDV
jgi:hypothetical protein